MKKIGLGILAVLLAAAGYYFFLGKAQLTQEMKTRVNTELGKIEKNGFAIQARKIQEKEEHFVLTFDDPEKIVHFLKQQGSDVDAEEIKALKGLKVGVDLLYLNDSYSALSAELYPLQLPETLSHAQDMGASDKALMAQLNAMMKKKVFLLHVDFNKMLSSFKGYSKDINETFRTETPMHVELNGNTFEGSIKDDRLNTMAENIKTLSVTLGTELSLKLHNLSTKYAQTGSTLYETRTDYSLEDANITGQNKNQPFAYRFTGIEGSNITEAKAALASNKVDVRAKTITLASQGEKTLLEETHFSFSVKNIDLKVLEKIETLDSSNSAAFNTMLQELISKGVVIEIPDLSTEHLSYKGQKTDGFSLNSSLAINKSANIAALQANPFALIDAIDAKTSLTLSASLFSVVSSDPRAMLMMMLIQPKVINGEKHYDVELKAGKLIVNGKPVM